MGSILISPFPTSQSFRISSSYFYVPAGLVICSGFSLVGRLVGENSS